MCDEVTVTTIEVNVMKLRLQITAVVVNVMKLQL